MAAKYLYSLADENPDLQKQIGCVTGVFQIFNRHHIVSGRRVFSHSPKRGDSGGVLLNNGTPQRESSASRPMNRQNLDLRDVVKDSMHREARGLSHNMVMEKESNCWYHDDPKELSRSKSCRFRDRIPRFSYDGQETDCLSIKNNSRTTNPKQMKELPRLSLDSRERERFIHTFSLVPINLSRNPKINVGVDADKDLSHTRPPGVVAKLMGLETFPLLKSPKYPCLKNPNMKPISRLPIEPAPWKHESHVVIMKPTKPVKKGFANNKTGKDLTESTRGERRSRPSMPLKDSSKPRKDSTKQRSSPNGRKKPSNFKKIDDQNRETRMLSSSTLEKTTLLVKMGEPLTPEYPSPVSVLDDSVYVDNSPSPVKHTPITKKGDTTKKIVKDRYEATNVVQSRTMTSSLKFQTNHEKLKKVEDLVQKLKNLNSTHNESHTDYIPSLYENTNPNDKYISEIFLASGLLFRDLKSFNLHPSGYPINPELFLVLEHTKYGNLQNEKVHRKLIFDAVNEILVGKLSSGSGMMMMQDPRKVLREVCLEIEQVQVCKKRYGFWPGDDGDGDVLKKLETWTGFYGESPVIAMEVEWLILLDLVDEVVLSQ